MGRSGQADGAAVKRDFVAEGFAVLVGASATLCWFGAALVVVGDVFHWLATAEWRAVEVAAIWGWFGAPAPSPSFPTALGIERIAKYVLQMPLSSGLLCLGVIIFLVGCAFAWLANSLARSRW